MRMLLTVLALMVGTAAWAKYPSAQQQLKLDEGMTMQEVLDLLGEPDSTESSTCGTATKKPWPCRTWEYRGGGRFFRVLFQQDGKYWTVNSWTS